METFSKIANVGKVFLESTFNPFGVIKKTEKMNKYSNVINMFGKSTVDFLNEFRDYCQHNSIVSNKFKNDIILFIDEYNAFNSMWSRFCNYISGKAGTEIAANSKAVLKELKPLYKKAKELSLKLDELHRLLEREKMGIAHPDMDLPELLSQRLRQNAITDGQQTTTSTPNNTVDLELLNSLKEQYSQLVIEIRAIYTRNGIHENQIEFMNAGFGLTEQYENYKRKEMSISVLNEQNTATQNKNEAMLQRLITELRETIDLLINLTANLRYSFDRFNRNRNAQTWFNEMSSQATRRAREINTDTLAIETETPPIEWSGSSYSSCIVRREEI